jgi:hypothetical protein
MDLSLVLLSLRSVFVGAMANGFQMKNTRRSMHYLCVSPGRSLLLIWPAALEIRLSNYFNHPRYKHDCTLVKNAPVNWFVCRSLVVCYGFFGNLFINIYYVWHMIRAVTVYSLNI